MRRASVLAAIVSFLLVEVTPGLAQSDECYFLNVTVTDPSYSGCDDPAIDAGTCDDLAFDSPSIPPAFVWMVMSEIGGFSNGIGSVGFSIEHSLSFYRSWSLCTGGTEEFTDGWPESRSAIYVTWEDECYQSPGENARVGFLAVDDAYGSFALWRHPDHDRAIWTDCSGDARDMLYYGHFGSDGQIADGGTPLCVIWGENGEPYCNRATPVHERSWAAVKATYR